MAHPSSTNHRSTPYSDENIGFDQILKQLRHLVAQLEQGNLSLESALQAFEEGILLARKGAIILDQAEHRVDLLSQDEKGAPKIEPLLLDMGNKTT